jgi:hypothetical protein
MSKFIDVVSNGVKRSINVSGIISVQEADSEGTIIFLAPSGDSPSITVPISYDDVMELIRE